MNNAPTQASLEARAPSAGDLEQGATAKQSPSVHVETDTSLKYMYILIYALSAVSFAMGGYLLFSPQKFYREAYISGGAFLVCGTMLMMNNDFIVATIRMWVQLQGMKSYNDELEALRLQEAEEVRRLRDVQCGLESLHKSFGSDVERAFREVDTLADNTRSKIRAMASQFVAWYLDSNKDGVLSRGEEQEAAEGLVTDFFKKALSDYPERQELMRNCLKQNAVYRQLQGVPTDKFALLVSAMLSCDVEAEGVMQLRVDEILSPVKVDALKQQELKRAASKPQPSNSLSQSVGQQIASARTLQGFATIVEDYSKPSGVRTHLMFWLVAALVVTVVSLLGSYKVF